MFYLGVHKPVFLERTAVPLFVSRRSLAGRRTLPRALGPWALDSGGFTELSLSGGWTTSPRQYVDEVRRFAGEVGQLIWASPQDWMCEPGMLARTGLSIAEHQRRTVANVQELRTLAPELPWIPVLQGWHCDDYLRHLDLYLADRVAIFGETVVGVGSVCRRQATQEAEGIIRTLAGLGLRLHGFGFKTAGLLRLGGVLVSADSMAWSFRARKIGRALCGSATHANCANCLPFALRWREELLARLAGTRQPALPLALTG